MSNYQEPGQFTKLYRGNYQKIEGYTIIHHSNFRIGVIITPIDQQSTVEMLFVGDMAIEFNEGLQESIEKNQGVFFIRDAIQRAAWALTKP